MLSLLTKSLYSEVICNYHTEKASAARFLDALAPSQIAELLALLRHQ